MATARDIIILCMKEAGVLGVGQSLLAEDINDGFTLLTRMMAQWQKRRWLVPYLYEVAALGNNSKSNLIGPGQYYNAARPDKIQAAYFKQVGGVTGNNNVSYPLTPIWSYENYANVQLKELNSWPQYFFYDGQFPYGNVYIWPIPSSQYEIHLVVKGPIGFTIELLAGNITTAGAGYVDGSYISVPFVNTTGFGSAGTGDITVVGGKVTTVAIHNPGDGYKIGDVLTVNNSDLGGTGAGFVYTVTDVTSDLDAEMNMPPEYEEAIHYNLCVRLTSMYQFPANPVQGKLAMISLNTIKNANAQIPTLQMPKAYRFGNGSGGFYIFNADQM